MRVAPKKITKAEWKYGKNHQKRYTKDGNLTITVLVNHFAHVLSF